MVGDKSHDVTVSPTVPPSSGGASYDVVVTEGQSPTAVMSSASMGRFDKHRRLRRAMAAKEATLLAITRLIIDGSKPGQITSTVPRHTTPVTLGEHLQSVGDSTAKTDVPAAAALSTMNAKTSDTTATAVLTASPSDLQGIAELRQVIGENEHLRAVEAAHAKERARLEKLVYDLRWELEAAGDTLRDQTTAMRLMGAGMARMDPHRMVKIQREQQLKSMILSDTEHEKQLGLQRELQTVRERVKSLENLLSEQRDKSGRVGKHPAEEQTSVLQSNADKVHGDVDVGEEVGGNLLVHIHAGKDAVEHKMVTEDYKGKTQTDVKSLTDTARSLEETYLMARRMWKSREKEFKRYIRILETTITRMERLMPSEKPNKAILFNLTLGLVSCEKLLNRRNNGVGFIDPFVVVFGPNGEKAFETLPREDTDCPEFSDTEDVVTLKVARGSPWNLVFEVYSRGGNNARLFLGRAEIPVGPLLEDVVTGGVTRHSAKLRPRDREIDKEIVQHAAHLGVIFFRVSATVVGAADRNGIQRAPPVGLAKRQLLSRCDREQDIESISGLLATVDCCDPAGGLTLRVAGAKGILKRELKMNSSPYVVAIDSSSGEELLRTPPVIEACDPSWENCEQASVNISALEPHGCILFHVYDYNEGGKDEFLGKAHLPKKLLLSGKEWHELKLYSRENERLSYIIDNRERLGKLLVQCTYVTQCDTKRRVTKEHRHLNPNSRLSNRLLGSLESSKILYDDSAPAGDNSLLKPFFVQVHVEKCRGLSNSSGKGNIFVRVVAPDASTYVTSAVPYAQNPSWSESDGCTTLKLHPLDFGVIGFHVVLNESQPGDKSKTLGYARLVVVDLFRRGLGRKELQLTGEPHGGDVSFCQNGTCHGSIVVSFALFSSSPVQIENKCEKAAVEVGATSAKAESSRATSVVAPPFSLSASCASAVSLKKTADTSDPNSLCMRIYVKEGHNLLDCDQLMFNVFGVTDPRVMVWVGANHAFTVPEKHDTVNPKWDLDEGEFVVSLQSSQMIRFEVQDVDVAGFDSMGCATVMASEVIASPGEHSLPVMLDGKQYGTLDVVFTLDIKGHSSS